MRLVDLHVMVLMRAVFFFARSAIAELIKTREIKVDIEHQVHNTIQYNQVQLS